MRNDTLLLKYSTIARPLSIMLFATALSACGEGQVSQAVEVDNVGASPAAAAPSLPAPAIPAATPVGPTPAAAPVSDAPLPAQPAAPEQPAESELPAAPAQPAPAQPDPVQPEPAQPEPAQPEPAQPEPEQPEPAQPEPEQPEPEQPEPAQPEPEQPEPLVCTDESQKQWAYEELQGEYLFYDKVPAVDPQKYLSLVALVRDLRYNERDPYSYVSNTAQSALIFDEGREFKLGYRWRRDDDEEPRIIQVIDDSPFGKAGIERGDIILGVDGLLWSDPELSRGFTNRVVGTPENPSTATWQFQKNTSGEIFTVDITAAEYDVNTVLSSDVYSREGWPGKIGYLAFNRFLETSELELNDAFSSFVEEDIDELVLDLRYNGGGRIRIAAHLASLISGNRLEGQILYDYRFNDKIAAERNYNLTFPPTGFSTGLNLSRVIVLTSSGTASSSEIVIAGLQPYMEVITIGEKTNGKPYISYGKDRCGLRLNLMKAEGFNASNVSVYGGVEAICYAADDLSRNFGEDDNGNFEGMLGAGINYILDANNCAVPPMANASRSSLTKSFAPDEPLNGLQGMSILGGAQADQ